MTTARRFRPIIRAALLVLAFAVCGRSAGAATRFDGVWRIVLAHPGGALPVGLEIGSVRGKPAAWLLNPPERLRVEQFGIDGDRLTLAFPSYGSRIVATIAGGRLTGAAEVVRRSGRITLPLTGTRAAYRFFPTPARPAADIAGRWIVETNGDSPERGLAQLRVAGNRVTGSVQFPSGDTRFLAGEVSGNRLALSMFDGNSTGLWTATLTGTTLTGARFAASSSATGTPFTARRAGGDTVEAVVVETPKTDRIAFSFPDRTGKRIALTDPRFKGKVVVVTIGGAWCPNCHDEARFIGPYAAAHAKDGLELIGLQFEYGDDPVRAFAQIDRFAARYRLTYPLLLAGQPTPESSKAALPSIGGVRVYPSTLFIGRDGRLREIHVGWAGPATGPLNAQAKRDFDATVKRLLAERG